MPKFLLQFTVAITVGSLLLSEESVPAWAFQQTPSAPASSSPAAPRQPRAKTEEEFSAYQRFIRETNPDEQIRIVEDFLLQYPDSELKEYAFQTATQAYQTKNDFPRVLTYGELTLAENPDNLVALLILASAIAERTGKNDEDRDEKLTQAEEYAKRALDLLPRMPQPAGVTAARWEQTKREAAASSHGALGMLNLIREDFSSAELELKRSADLATLPDPVTFYRLGLCYSFQKNFDPALEALDRADSVGGVKIMTPEGGTRDLVAEAREFVLKSKEALGSPGAGSEVSPSQPPAAP
jgi:tetratricopeptide (TPR) repeat protein